MQNYNIKPLSFAERLQKSTLGHCKQNLSIKTKLVFSFRKLRLFKDQLKYCFKLRHKFKSFRPNPMLKKRQDKSKTPTQNTLYFICTHIFVIFKTCFSVFICQKKTFCLAANHFSFIKQVRIKYLTCTTTSVSFAMSQKDLHEVGCGEGCRSCLRKCQRDRKRAQPPTHLDSCLCNSELG